MPEPISNSTSPDRQPDNFTDVVGIATEPGRMGAIGINNPDNAFGFLAGNDLVFHEHAGVYGQSDQQGVIGIGTTGTSTGVFGGNREGSGFGVRGETRTGVAVQGQSFGPGLAGKFVGDVEVTGGLVVAGTLIDPSVLEQVGTLKQQFGTLQQQLGAQQQQLNTLQQQVSDLQRQLSHAQGTTVSEAVLQQIALKIAALEQAVTNINIRLANANL